MRSGCLLLALLLLTRCAGMSTDSPDQGTASSQTGSEAGAGVQAPIWSTDPGQKTLTNHSSLDSSQ